MKQVLLIGGGGTLGSYTYKELLQLGHRVDVICLEDKGSDDERLTFYKAEATLAFLTEFLKEKHYDGIVNFVYYADAEEYKPVHQLLSKKTEHLIFTSSYRVYADLEHPITENAPLLLDAIKDDKDFLENEDYALSKAKAERYIREESGTDNWTIIRPVISFSDKRLDIVITGERKVLEYYKEGKVIRLPACVKNVVAGLDWAGNSGKLIANLLFKKEALKEAYTISSAPNITWGEVADLYTELIGTKFEWVDTEEWLQDTDYIQCDGYYWAAIYDRFYDRTVDCSKVLQVTGLKQSDFKSIREGIEIELSNIKGEEK